MAWALRGRPRRSWRGRFTRVPEPAGLPISSGSGEPGCLPWHATCGSMSAAAGRSVSSPATAYSTLLRRHRLTGSRPTAGSRDRSAPRSRSCRRPASSGVSPQVRGSATMRSPCARMPLKAVPATSSAPATTSGTAEVGWQISSPVSCSCQWLSCDAEQALRAPSVRPAAPPRSPCPSCWRRVPGERRLSRSTPRQGCIRVPIAAISGCGHRGTAPGKRASFRILDSALTPRAHRKTSRRRNPPRPSGPRSTRLPAGPRRWPQRRERVRLVAPTIVSLPITLLMPPHRGPSCRCGLLGRRMHSRQQGCRRSTRRPPVHARAAAAEGRGNSAARREAARPRPAARPDMPAPPSQATSPSHTSRRQPAPAAHPGTTRRPQPSFHRRRP